MGDFIGQPLGREGFDAVDFAGARRKRKADGHFGREAHGLLQKQSFSWEYFHAHAARDRADGRKRDVESRLFRRFARQSGLGRFARPHHAGRERIPEPRADPLRRGAKPQSTASPWVAVKCTAWVSAPNARKSDRSAAAKASPTGSIEEGVMRARKP